MTTKEYLNQAYWLDKSINSKYKMIDRLRSLSTKCTSSVTGMPKNPGRSLSGMADAAIKIADLENEIQADISKLVDLKREIMLCIDTAENPEHKALLELRYLCYCPWNKIAEEMGFGIDNVFKLHKKALKTLKIPETLQ